LGFTDIAKFVDSEFRWVLGNAKLIFLCLLPIYPLVPYVLNVVR